ncbi:hypothetical protein [Dongshaea marina]|uniref:hypothetical protein n=1 Tax=Dongshaea marina TaxID=2047966 RepID=UPI000D3E7279|nr:hypothetical protein [Dongshaea marina]
MAKIIVCLPCSISAIGHTMHGFFKVKVTPPIMFIEGYGPWSDTVAQAFCEEVKCKSLELCQAPWGTVIDQRQWDLGTPRVWELFDDLLIYMLDHGLVCQAILPSMHLHQHLAQKHFETVSPDIVKVKFFTEYDAALQWCQQQLQLATTRKE